jgi:hypothetical protein
MPMAVGAILVRNEDDELPEASEIFAEDSADGPWWKRR